MQVFKRTQAAWYVQIGTHDVVGTISYRFMHFIQIKTTTTSASYLKKGILYSCSVEQCLKSIIISYC